MYFDACRACLVLDLARSPDVHVRAYLRAYRERNGADAMKALADEVHATRRAHAPTTAAD